MNAEGKITVADADGYAALLQPALDRLSPLARKIGDIKTALDQLEPKANEAMRPSINRIRNKLRSFQPSVTMIGQVKAGKTTLASTMAGWPGLLPADVNPWTSVVTALHLDPRLAQNQQAASFRFFSCEEWDRLVVNGGRVGELAGRAGVDSEVEKVRRQIAEMRETAKLRLGRKFELLLGQSHDYSHLDEALVERYVCQGDGFENETETSNARGRFADVTKSADLYIRRPELSVPLCLRDTPGVNDTFMVREQITIRAIRDSRICVVVLSAHQALSAVDMALIRMITNVKAREVVIFVNRIDELKDPAHQVPEIRDSIQATLRAHRGPEDAQILFGSALWASQALGAEAAIDSSIALQNWAAACGGQAPASEGAPLAALSGVPDLYDAIAERICDGTGADMLAAVARDVRNLASGIRASEHAALRRASTAALAKSDPTEVVSALQRVAANAEATITQELGLLLQELEIRVTRSHQIFLQRATAALIEHLENWGETSTWKYDPTGLRVLFRSAYMLFAKRANDRAKSAFDTAARDIGQLYWQLKLVEESTFAIEPPTPPQAPAPVLLGQTIALDLQTNWWVRWWRRKRGYDAYAKEFYALIHAETQPILSDLLTDHAATAQAETLRTVRAFVEDQSRILLGALGHHPPEAQPKRVSNLPERPKARLAEP